MRSGGMPTFAPAHAQNGYTNASDSAGPAKLYGALLDEQMRYSAEQDKLTKRRRRVNCVPVLLALLVPWGFFVLVFGIVAFYCHYAAPLMTTLFALGALFASAWAARSSISVAPEDKFFRTYLGAGLFVGAAAGWVAGDLTFWELMQPAYHAEHLATYMNVNPSSETLWSGESVPTRGLRYQDAGKVYFGHDVILDVSRARSFKLGDLYCVAPIVDPKCKKNCGLDFWAVGMNCCSEDAADFRCGEFNNTHAKSGLRMLVENRRPLYRMAVLQAEASHDVFSPHPIFFYFLQDPVAEVRSWKRDGYSRFILAMIASFFVNAAMLVPAMKRARLMHF